MEEMLIFSFALGTLIVILPIIPAALVYLCLYVMECLELRPKRPGGSVQKPGLSRSFLFVGAAAILASGVLASLAWLWWPDASLKVPHLPLDIVELFPETFGGTAERFQRFVLQLGVAVTATITVLFWCLLAHDVLVVGRAKPIWPAGTYLGRLKGAWPKSTRANLMFAVAATVTTGALSVNLFDYEPVIRSDRMAFLSHAEKAEYSAVEKLLKGAQASDAAKNYILSQVIVAHAQQSGKPLEADARNLLVERVKQLDVALTNQVNFSVSPQAIYAIEMAAWGAPSSAIAVQYLNKSQRKAGLARTGSVIAGLLALAAGFAAGGMAWIRGRRRARVERIARLTT